MAKFLGNVDLNQSGGDEGGELHLASPVTNSTISGNVVIDVYQNKLRIFESTGTNRGAYIDLTAASTGVGSNLLAGGGGGATTLDGLTDVTAPSPSTGDFLKWNGSAWVNDPINLGTDTTGDYVASLVAGSGITITNNSGEGATPTVALTDKTVTTSITANSLTTVDSFALATYRSAEYLVQVTQGTKYTVSKVLLIHDDTTPTMTEYGVVEIGASRIPLTISTTISGSNVLLQVLITDAASTNATVKLIPTYMAV